MGAKVSFDEINKIINITLAPDGNGDVFIDVKIDLYSDGKEDWITYGNLRKFLFPITTAGGNPLPGSKSLGATFFLASDWKIKPYAADHRLTINGNLYSVDGSDPFINPEGGYSVRIMQQVSSLVDSTIQQLPEIEQSMYQDMVTVDKDNGVAGTAYPIGTPKTPVNNIPQAYIIAAARGFEKIMIRTSMDFDQDILGKTVIGNSVNVILTISEPLEELPEPAPCALRNISVTGELCGQYMTFDECILFDLSRVIGSAHDSELRGMIEVGGGFGLVNCVSGTYEQFTRTTLDFSVIPTDGSGQTRMSNHSGGIKLTNLNCQNYTIVGDFNSGIIEIDDTCVAGKITLRGIGYVIDRGGPDLVRDFNMVNSEAIEYVSFNEGITVDAVSGTDSSLYPYGTPNHPCKTLMNLGLIAIRTGIRKIYVLSDMLVVGVPDVSLVDITFIGIVGFQSKTITLDGVLTTNTVFENLIVTGNVKDNSTMKLKDCVITNLLNAEITSENCFLYNGTYKRTEMVGCTLEGDFKVDEGGWFSGVKIVFNGDFNTIDCQGLVSTVSLDIDSGYVELLNFIPGCLAEFNLRGGELELNDSITGGDLYLEGYGTLFGDPEALGMNVKANHLLALETIPPFIRENLSAELAEISIIKKFIANRLRVNKDTGEWTVYNDAGDTPLYTGTISDDGTFKDRVPA